MDSIISIGQKNTLTKYMILFGADNRPPMLDKDLYDSWKSIMELYMQNREHGRMILESVEHGPLIWPTVEENGVIRTKKYAELSAAEKIQADCDMKATNIILQGLPADIYSLERECKLYDAFDKFTHIKGESLHTYYLRFTQLINDMNIYKMKMEQFQVNTKFLNSLPPEWSKFVTDVKLVKYLHTSNFDQLHAYLKQHKLHANEVCIMRERNQDPLAFVANQQMTPPHFNTYQSSYNNPQLQQQFSPSQHGSIQPNQHYSSHYPSQTQFNHSSIPPSHTFQSQMNHQTSTVPQVIPPVVYQSPQAPTQLMTESSFGDSGFVVPVFSLGDDPIACLNKAMAFLIAVASLRAMLLVQEEILQVDRQELLNAITAMEAGQILDEEQLAFLADPRILTDQAQSIIPHNAAFQTEDLDTYDSDCDDLSTAQAVLMANISNYGSDVISEKTQRIKPTLYDGVVMSNAHVAMPVIDDEETLILEEESRSKMSEKAKDPEVIAKKISHKPIDYEKINRLAEDFGKSFSPQQELSAEQAFWFNILNPSIESSYTPPVIVDVPSELPKVSLVNASLKKLKFHFTQFDSVVKKRIIPNALEEGECGFEHTKTIFNNEIIPFLKSLKDIFNVFDKDLLNKITEVQIVFDQMDAAVQQSSIDKQCLEIAKKEILLENDRLLQKIMSQYVMLTVMNSMSLNNNSVNMEMQKCESCEKCLNLDVELSKSKQAYNDLLKNYSQLKHHCISLEVSMQLKQEVFQNDESCVNQNAVEIQEYFEINNLKAQLQDKDNTICKLKDTIKSLRKNNKEENMNHDKCELEPINEKLENSVAKLLSENERLCNEINHVKRVFNDQFDSIKQTRVRHKEHNDSLINKLNLKYVENEDLKAQIQDKLDLEPLPPRLLQNREAHIDYLRHTQEQANTLCEIVEQAKAKQPLDKELDFAWFLLYTKENPNGLTKRVKVELTKAKQPLDSELDLACKYATRIQELLVYVQDTCPNAIIPSAKKVAVKPMNNVKKVRFAEPLTSSSNIKQVKSSYTSDSNTPVLSSTRVKCSTSNYGLKPLGNKRNDKISQSPCRNKKNKVEAQPRKVNKVNHVVKPVCDVDVKHSLSKANYEILCATCNKSMFDGVHDKCLLDLVVQIVLWYLDFGCSKHMIGNRSQLIKFVSKFLGTVRFRNDQIARIMGYDLKVAFRKNTCFIRNLEGVDLLSGSQDTNLYTISLDDMLKSSPICLLSKASKTKSWLWHRRLSHLNFGTLNKLAKDVLA
ncbi:retrovirus-related pol polyprotein from transposon TNT 1-94 [Tanacetum coccineum]|uniref:Retrovirus-related pol polyprotein from transposon TNT 1-94 n=1 Tax=Tanacetum coccineum TaxID=301880 RepID=A0ABQ5EAY2_9ASTR